MVVEEESSAIPTRIVGEPLWVTVSRGRPFLAYLADNGREYKASELAALIGIGTATFRNRVARLGWASRKLLQSPDAFRLEQKKETAARHAGDTNGDGGNEEWARLGGRTRPHNFSLLRPPGIWERREERP